MIWKLIDFNGFTVNEYLLFKLKRDPDESMPQQWIVLYLSFIGHENLFSTIICWRILSCLLVRLYSFYSVKQAFKTVGNTDTVVCWLDTKQLMARTSADRDVRLQQTSWQKCSYYIVERRTLFNLLRLRKSFVQILQLFEGEF